MLLIAGIMIGYITSSLISLLNFFATAEGVHSYMVWGMGNFGGVSLEQLPAFSLLTVVGLLVAVMLIKPLNALAFGTALCRKFGSEYSPGTQLLIVGYRIADCGNDFILWSYIFHRSGSSSSGPFDAGYLQP